MVRKKAHCILVILREYAGEDWVYCEEKLIEPYLFHSKYQIRRRVNWKETWRRVLGIHRERYIWEKDTANDIDQMKHAFQSRVPPQPQHCQTRGDEDEGQADDIPLS